MGGRGCEDFACKRQEPVFNAFSNSETVITVKTAKDGTIMTGFRSFDNSTHERVLDLLKAGYLRLRKVVVMRITIRPWFHVKIKLF